MYTAQAPQCFKLDDLLKWHYNERQKGDSAYAGIVDSCTLAMANGGKPHLTIGNRGNVKVTTNEDYLMLIANSLANDVGEFLNLRYKSAEAISQSAEEKEKSR